MTLGPERSTHPTPERSTDPTYDVLRSERQPLAALFQPRSVAVVGASERPGRSDARCSGI